MKKYFFAFFFYVGLNQALSIEKIIQNANVYVNKNSIYLLNQSFQYTHHTSFTTKSFPSELVNLKESSVSKHLCYALTSQHNKFNAFDLDEQNMHIYSRWIRSINTTRVSNSSSQNNKSNHKIILSPGCKHTSFHNSFGAMLLKNIEKNNIPSADGEFLIRRHVENAEYSLDGVKNFSQGHCKVIEGITRYNKVFVSMYDENEVEFLKKTNRRKRVRWLCPIDQAFLFDSLGQYRNNLAILKNWGSYTGFILVIVPAGIPIKVRLGLASPQQFPRFDKLAQANALTLLHEIEDLKNMTTSLTNLGKDKDLLIKLFEEQKGGAVQFEILYLGTESSNREKIIKLPNALKSPTGLKQKIWGKKEISDDNNKLLEIWASLKEEKEEKEESHFFDKSYDTSLIRIHESLKELGLLPDKDYTNFLKIIDFVKNN